MQMLEAKPHELRAWLRLEPLASRQKDRRHAVNYSPLDALFLVVVKRLDAAGFAPKALQSFSASLYKALQHPPAESEPDELFLHRKPDGAWKTGRSAAGADGLELRIALRQARANLLRYTGAHLLSPQIEMLLLTPIASGSTKDAQQPAARRAAR
jgi:hypothetical protein